MMIKLHEYPALSERSVSRDEARKCAPNTPGVYFAWADGAVVYVGSSGGIRSRIRESGHHGIRQGDTISWLEFDSHMVLYAEAYYIGVLLPERNFGTMGMREHPTETIEVKLSKSDIEFLHRQVPFGETLESMLRKWLRSGAISQMHENRRLAEEYEAREQFEIEQRRSRWMKTAQSDSQASCQTG